MQNKLTQPMPPASQFDPLKQVQRQKQLQQQGELMKQLQLVQQMTQNRLPARRPPGMTPPTMPQQNPGPGAPEPKTMGEFARLPKGTIFIDPVSKETRRKS